MLLILKVIPVVQGFPWDLSKLLGRQHIAVIHENDHGVIGPLVVVILR
jgi:hypothetical protein